ncbi:NAD(P)H-quinone oxidoreductase [Tistrella mobilis]|uniref:Quinone oxidoreductase n=1 Tax=Tistrella mobilis (strain KA081020-065) TaxID=1110502 RepID=I3TIV3_TISMK|nr:NAD(P)H-quinone oxidoreductase [Tistrella mobilis]AFK52691.1 quinone oxidoreductase [Tistrella mobilis KA081020-065]
MTALPQTALPDTMTAIEITAPGGPEVLKPCTRPVPQPGHGEVLIRVAAAGVNKPDSLQRQGNYPPPPGASDIPGLEVAGVVVAAGDGVTRVKPGDRVCALVTGGGYAEYVAAPQEQCLPVPAGLDLVKAAALPETYFTVWTNVFERGALKAGERLLVHGGSSGIGTTAIQLAAALGAEVYATAGSDDKCRACEELGATLAINYRTADFKEAVEAATVGDPGVDVVLDMVGGPYLGRNLQLLRRDGRLVYIAFLQGPKTEVDLRPIMMKRLTVTGSTLRARPVAEKAAIADALAEKVWPLIEAGRVGPVIDSVVPFDRAAEAHARLDGSTHVGKIVLKVADL